MLWLRRFGMPLLLTGATCVMAQVAAVSPIPSEGAFLALYHRPPASALVAEAPSHAARVSLGERLFFDRSLSRSGQLSCASCHDPHRAWQDGRPLGIGVTGRVLPRRTPTLLNIAWSQLLFWDGRAETLEVQALVPMFAADEMGLHPAALIPAVTRDRRYRHAFSQAFPGEAPSATAVAAALAAFQRTIVSTSSPFDRWIAGDSGAVSSAAKRGFVLFNTKARCASCHSGWRLTDDSFHDIGLPDNDLGRAAIIPGVTVLEHAFKTPTLRNIADRPPYMHNGSLATLEQVLDHYNDGFVPRPSLAGEVVPLGLNAADKRDLIAFMKTLSSGSLSGNAVQTTPRGRP